MWLRVFTWFKLFDITAFYTKLLYETFKEMLHFMILYIWIIMLFANVLFILNKKREFEFGDRIYSEKF